MAMRRSMKRLVIGTAILLSACSSGSGGSGWPDSAVQSFLNQCPFGSAICQCMVHRLEKTISYADFKAARERGGGPPPEFTEAARECRGA